MTIPNTSAFAFYGSLRRGMENHALHSHHLKYLFSARLSGYELYSRGNFPVAVPASPGNSIVVEVFQIDDMPTREMIHKLEMDEGYYLHEEDLDGVHCAIYLYKEPKNYKQVKSGDWVSFFRERSK